MEDTDITPTGAVEPTTQPTTESTQPTPAESVFGEGSSSVTEPNQPAVETTPGVEPTQPAQATPPAAMTPEQIAQIASQSALATQQQQMQLQAQQQEQQPKQYTAEELNVYSMDEEKFAKIFDSEDKAVAIGAMNDMLQGVAKQAYTMAQIHANNQLQERFTQLDQRLQPHLTFAQQQQEQAMAQQFYSSYPHLNGMDSVVQQVTAQMNLEQVKYPTQQALFAEVEKRTQAIIQTISGQPAQKVAGVQGQTPQQVQPTQQIPNKPQMATVGAGGTGGAGGGQGTSPAKPNAAKSIFG